jgi:hypothetical protein
MIPSSDFVSLSGNTASCGTCDLNPSESESEIDSQRRRSIESGRADKKEEIHSDERKKSRLALVTRIVEPEPRDINKEFIYVNLDFEQYVQQSMGQRNERGKLQATQTRP